MQVQGLRGWGLSRLRRLRQEGASQELKGVAAVYQFPRLTSDRPSRSGTVVGAYMRRARPDSSSTPTLLKHTTCPRQGVFLFYFYFPSPGSAPAKPPPSLEPSSISRDCGAPTYICRSYRRLALAADVIMTWQHVLVRNFRSKVGGCTVVGQVGRVCGCAQWMDWRRTPQLLCFAASDLYDAGDPCRPVPVLAATNPHCTPRPPTAAIASQFGNDFDVFGYSPGARLYMNDMILEFPYCVRAAVIVPGISRVPRNSRGPPAVGANATAGQFQVWMVRGGHSTALHSTAQHCSTGCACWCWPPRCC